MSQYIHKKHKMSPNPTPHQALSFLLRHLLLKGEHAHKIEKMKVSEKIKIVLKHMKLTHPSNMILVPKVKE